MAFWWVNHKQTYRQETDGGYVWSPKANANGARNVSYDNLTRCQRGDVVFSYAYGRISQIGLVLTAAVTAPKPPEFGSTGEYWSPEGWLVQVNWLLLHRPLVPQTFFELLQPLLPVRHSPISTNSGRGNRCVHLAGLAEEGDAQPLLDNVQLLHDVCNDLKPLFAKAVIGYPGITRVLSRMAGLGPRCTCS